MIPEWISLKGNTGYFILGNALLTTYRLSEHEIVLIDSGVKEDPVILEFMRMNGISVRTVIHTHLHTDHIANDRMLMKHYGCNVVASQRELLTLRSRDRIRTERGSVSPENVEYTFQTCNFPISVIESGENCLEIDGKVFTKIPLPGHSKGHIGIVTPDGVCCVGDAVLSPFMLEHAKLPYLADAGEYIASMRFLQKTDYPFYTIVHKTAVSGPDMPALLEQNLVKEQKILERIDRLLDENGPEELTDSVQRVLESFNIHSLEGRNKETFSFAARMRILYLLNRRENAGEGVMA